MKEASLPHRYDRLPGRTDSFVWDRVTVGPMERQKELLTKTSRMWQSSRSHTFLEDGDYRKGEEKEIELLE